MKTWEKILLTYFVAGAVLGYLMVMLGSSLPVKWLIVVGATLLITGFLTLLAELLIWVWKH
jgi:hypothetical protein